MKTPISVCLAVLLTVLLAGCPGSCRVRTAPPNAPIDRPASPGAQSKTAMTTEQPVDVGDAEAALRLTLTLPEEPNLPNVTVEELRNTRNDLDMVTLTVPPPHPQPFNIQIGLTSTKAFPETPLAVRITVSRDGSVIDTQSVVMAGDAVKKPFNSQFNALAGRDAIPDTMLLSAQAEIVMLPAGTDPAAVDPASVAGTPETTGSLLGNPVRINFVQQAPAP